MVLQNYQYAPLTNAPPPPPPQAMAPQYMPYPPQQNQARPPIYQPNGQAPYAQTNYGYQPPAAK